jgi:hypothetical protein
VTVGIALLSSWTLYRGLPRLTVVSHGLHGYNAFLHGNIEEKSSTQRRQTESAYSVSVSFFYCIFQ